MNEDILKILKDNFAIPVMTKTDNPELVKVLFMAKGATDYMHGDLYVIKTMSIDEAVRLRQFFDIE